MFTEAYRLGAVGTSKGVAQKLYHVVFDMYKDNVKPVGKVFSSIACYRCGLLNGAW